MKTRIFNPVILLLIIVVMGSCKKISTTIPTNKTITFNATLTGASETPANPSTATGTATFTFDPNTNILSGTLTFAGITATAAHIHYGAVGVAGSVVFPLGSTPQTSPVSFTSVPLDATQSAELLANLFYVNVHSAAYPNGEIRGQLLQANPGTNGTGGGGGGGY